MTDKSTKSRAKISDMGLRDRRYLLFVGSLTKKEGVHYLIEAFKQLEDTAKTPNNFKMVVVANGEDQDDEDYVKYLHLISKKRSNIIFFCVRKRTPIKQLFEHAYLYVEPSESALPQGALFQALEYGLATLVSDVQENMDVVGDGAFTFKAKSVLNLRDRLAFLLSRPEEVSLMGERGKKIARKNLKKKEVSDIKKIILEENNKALWNWKNLLKK
jgi:glycosyltransferase involved in cell wall biosynthesis